MSTDRLAGSDTCERYEKCGPREFAEFILRKYDGQRDLWRQPVQGPRISIEFPASSDTIHELINVAYFGSLQKEEGEFAKPHLVLTESDVQPRPFRPVVTLANPGSVTIPSVAKLSHAIADGCALWVIPKENGLGSLTCRGILDCRGRPRPSFGSNFIEADLSKGVYDSQAHLIVRAQGPAEIEVSFAFERFLLKAGMIYSFKSYDNVRPIVQLFQSAAKFVSEKITTKLGRPFSLYWMEPLRWWSKILLRTIARAHGGCFLFVPNASLDGHFRDQTGVDLDFAQAIAHFECAINILHTSNSPDVIDAKALRKEIRANSSVWYSELVSLETLLESISSFANVDGCVVLDRNLKVRCFGAKIQKRERNSPCLPLVDFDDSNRDIGKVMEGLGTRHNSACTYCRENPGAVAFVISQDGDLRIYCSDDSSAYAVENRWVPDP